MPIRGLRQRVVVHRILLAQLVERERVAEEVVVVPRHRPNRLGAKRRHRDGSRRVVVGVGTQLGLDVDVDGGLLRRGQRVVLGAEPHDRDHVAQGDGFAVKPVGRPVGGDVAAMAPDGAELLAAGGKPRLLPVLDVVAREQLRAVGRHDRVGNRRCGEIDLAAEPTERREREDEHCPEPLPQLPGRSHCLHSFKSDGIAIEAF